MKQFNAQRIASAFCALLIVATLSAPSVESGANNVVIILDASGSMSGQMSSSSITKMDAAKAALREVIKQVSADTQIGLLIFGPSNANNGWAFPLGPRNDAALINGINSAAPNGGTPLGEYIKIGADRLIERRKEQLGYGTFRLLVVTDGEASDESLMNQYVPDVVSRGIIVDVIGVDMNTTHQLATMSHSYRRADDPAALKKAVADVFAEVGGASDASTTNDAFETIAPIPADLASAMLKALAAPNNQPIGEAEMRSAGSDDSGAPTGPVPPASDEGWGGSVCCVIAAAVFILIIAAKAMKQAK